MLPVQAERMTERKKSSIQSAITKIQSLFRTSAEKTDWIQVDFAPWNPKGAEVRTLFAQLKNAILSQRQIRFDYFSSAGKCGTRTVQPQKLIFRGQAWYLYGMYSQNEPENPADKEKSLADKKNRMRFFKLNRMRNITVLNVPVLPDAFEGLSDETGEIQFVRLTLKVSKSAVYRIMDEYSVESIEDTEDGTKIITLSLPEIYWLTYYLISFGTELEVLAPQKIRNNIAEEIRRINELYENKI